MSTLSNLNPLSYLGVIAPNPPTVVQTTRAPTSGSRGIDVNYAIGTIWVDTAAGTAYMLTEIVALTPTWDQIGSGATVISTINNQAPVGGNFNMVGTANQITVTPALGQDTFSIPAAFIAPGSIASTTTLTGGTGITATTGNIVATAGNISATVGSITAGTTVTATLGAITATNGNLVLGTAGNKLSIATGANASVGTTAALVGGTLLVANTSVTANSKFFFTTNTLGTVLVNQSYYVSARVPGVSFTVTSSDATDTSTVDFFFVN